LFEGKLGCNRRGRDKFENQAGERRIIILSPGGGGNDCPEPSAAHLLNLGVKAGSRDWLFVSDIPRETWNVPVLTVPGHHLLALRSYVETEFTQDSNALPPVFLRISLASRLRGSSTVSLATSSSVRCLSFDALAFQPRWGATSPGVSGKVGIATDWNPSIADEDADEPRRAPGTRAVRVTPDNGVDFILYTTDGSDPTGLSWNAGHPSSPWRSSGCSTLSKYECFALHPAELSRLEEHLNAAPGNVFISVRYAGK
jgi:hypothetical protein